MRLGFDEERFWALTPAEFNEYATEYGTVEHNALELAKASAYWVAMLSRAKNMPTYENWMHPPKPMRELDADEAEQRKREFEAFKALVETSMEQKQDG